MKKTSFIFVFTQGTVLHRTNFVTVVLKCAITLNVKYPLCFWSWLGYSQSSWQISSYYPFLDGYQTVRAGLGSTVLHTKY